MLPNLYAWAAAALSVAFVNAADSPQSSTPVGSLYAYGKGISGLPLIYSDGKYIYCDLVNPRLTIQPDALLLGWGEPAYAHQSTNLT